MNGPIIDEEGNEINIDNCCSICLEKMENNKYKIPECKHEFHNECLLTYFRVSNNTSCPLCRNIRQSSNLKTILNYSRRKNANKKIVNEVKKYKKFKISEKEISNELKTFKKTHKEILDKRKKLLNKKFRTKQNHLQFLFYKFFVIFTF